MPDPLFSPATVVGRRTALRAVRSGVAWGYLFGLVVASSALGYSSFYKSAAQRRQLAATFSSDHAAAALFGPARQLQTVAGFTVFKTSMTLMVLGAVWGLLASTRLLRGEEEAGRWELLLCGPTSRGKATAQALAGLGAGVLCLWAVTAVVCVVAGLSSKVDIAARPALFFALALVASAALFLAVGAVTSQLAATRRQAAAYAGAVLGVSYAVRMVADAGIGVHWLIWASPLGWVEELQPLTAPHPLALLPLAATTALLAAGAVMAAGRRDVGTGLVADRSSADPHLRLLGGPTGLALRTLRPVIVGWGAAIALAGLLFGLVAKAAGSTIGGTSVQQVFSRLGARGAGTDAFLGITFLLLAVLLAFVGAGQLSAARAEEAGGRLDHILAGPVSRSSWLGGRLLVATAVLVVSGLIGALFTWLATAAEHAGVSPSLLLGAGLNTVAPAFCLLGLGALAVGVVPRAATGVLYGLLGWSVLIELVGGVGRAGADNHWVLDTSVFHQMASAPAVAVNGQVDAVLVAVGVVAAAAGVVAFCHRDLRAE